MVPVFYSFLGGLCRCIYYTQCQDFNFTEQTKSSGNNLETACPCTLLWFKNEFISQPWWHMGGRWISELATQVSGQAWMHRGALSQNQKEGMSLISIADMDIVVHVCSLRFWEVEAGGT